MVILTPFCSGELHGKELARWYVKLYLVPSSSSSLLNISGITTQATDRHTSPHFAKPTYQRSPQSRERLRPLTHPSFPDPSSHPPTRTSTHQHRAAPAALVPPASVQHPLADITGRHKPIYRPPPGWGEGVSRAKLTPPTTRPRPPTHPEPTPYLPKPEKSILSAIAGLDGDGGRPPDACRAAPGVPGFPPPCCAAAASRRAVSIRALVGLG